MPPQMPPIPTNVLDSLRRRVSLTNMTPPDPSQRDPRQDDISKTLAANPLNRLLWSTTEPEARTTLGRGPYDAAQSEQDSMDVERMMADQRDEVGAIRGMQLGAQMSGFESPQAQAQYGRKMEQRKMELPLEIAKTNAQTQIDRLLEQQGSQDARTAAQIASREKIAGNAQAGQNARAGNAVPPQMTKALTTARNAYKGSAGGIIPDWMQGVTGKRDAYIAELSNVLRRTGSLDMITQAVQQSVQRGETFEQGLQQAQEAGIQLDPDEQEAFRLFLERARQGR